MRVSISPKGGFVVTDVTYLSPSRLATYVDCSRKYDYKYEQAIESFERSQLYLNQGIAYHDTIEAVCESASRNDDAEEIYNHAMIVFDEKWEQHSDRKDYASRAHEQYQRDENRAGIETFFDPDGGDGIDHARQSIATEEWLEYEQDGLGLHGRADNILRTDDGLHVIDYKRNLRNVISANTASVLQEHFAGSEYDPKRVKNTFQTATYVEGVKDSGLYEDGMTIQFSFYGLLNRTTHQGTPDGYTVSARGYPREMTEIYDEHYDIIWELIRQAHNGITENRFVPEYLELMIEKACSDCTYREMCPERLAQEVQQ